MSNKPSLFSELRRRNVFRVALTYAVVAWLLIEIASVLLPLVDAPESIITAFVVLLALGFAVALFISWAFEMTPEGLKRTQDLSPDEVIPYWSRRKFATFIYWRGRHCVLSFCLPPALPRASAEPFTERAGFDLAIITFGFALGKTERYATRRATSSRSRCPMGESCSS